MRLNDIFEEWDKKRGKTGLRTYKGYLINDFESMNEYSKELNYLIIRRSNLKITQPMLAKALGCARETIRNYETRRSKDDWRYIYSVKYILDNYEWHLRQMETQRLLVVAGTPIKQ